MTATLVVPHRSGEDGAGRGDPARWGTWPMPTAPAAAPALPSAVALPDRPPSVRLHLSTRQVAALPRYAPLLVAQARALLAAVEPGPSGARELVVDLSDVSTGAYCAELVFLVGLLRRALGPVRVRLVGVTPTVSAPLIGGGLGDDVVIVDARGRTWPGRPDGVRPIGTWP